MADERRAIEYGTREDEAIRPLLAEPPQCSCPTTYRQEMLRSQLRTERLLEAILYELRQSRAQAATHSVARKK